VSCGTSMSKASYRRPNPPWTQFALGVIGGWSDVFTLFSIREVPPAAKLPHAHPGDVSTTPKTRGS
jgi:hypothetical protein